MSSPSATPMPHDAAAARQVPKYRNFQRAGMTIGAVLLMAAIVIVLRQHQAIDAARQAIAQASVSQLATHVGVLAISVVINIALSGALFSLLIKRYGRVGAVEMQALIAAATLLNYVPMRPGLFGRLAYHRAYNNIPLADSVKTVLQAAAISAIVAGVLALAVVGAVQWGADIRVTAIAPLPIVALAGVLFRSHRTWCWAAAIRWLELLVIAARYHAAFALIGSPIDSTGSLAFACISMIAGMVPFLSSGLGVREWAVGLVAPILTGAQLTTGLTADLVNRAVELVVVLVCGVVGLGWLARHRSRVHRRGVNGPATNL
jgi:hypothetical protein